MSFRIFNTDLPIPHIPFLIIASGVKQNSMANIAQLGLELVQFHAALEWIGFPIAIQDALNEQRLVGMYNMMIYSKDQIKDVYTVIWECPINLLHISIEQEQFLTALQHWVKTRAHTNCSINPNLFTRNNAIAESIRMINIAEEVAIEKESDVKFLNDSS